MLFGVQNYWASNILLISPILVDRDFACHALENFFSIVVFNFLIGLSWKKRTSVRNTEVRFFVTQGRLIIFLLLLCEQPSKLYSENHVLLIVYILF